MTDLIEIPILYQDDHLLVVNKPARLLVVPAPGRSTRSVLGVLGRQLRSRLHAVHRLDEDTTGVLIVARTELAKGALEQQFRGHEVERVYLAVVGSTPSPPAGRIESRLHEDASGVVRSAAHGPGEIAVTHYRTLRRTSAGVLLECRLETGRRNQIRVHMAELGCPLVGDRKYGYRRRRERGAAQPLLHAWRVRFRHPLGGTVVVVEAPLPAGFPRPE